MGLEKLNYYKKQKGITNQQLANMTGITISTIDKITSGNNTNPKLRTIEAICKVLGCTLNDIMDFVDIKKGFAPTESGGDDADKQKLISNYDRMNETGQHCLVEYSDYLTSKPENLKSTADSHKMMA